MCGSASGAAQRGAANDSPHLENERRGTSGGNTTVMMIHIMMIHKMMMYMMMMYI
jgi:hypothetical protein